MAHEWRSWGLNPGTRDPEVHGHPRSRPTTEAGKMSSRTVRAKTGSGDNIVQLSPGPVTNLMSTGIRHRAPSPDLRPLDLLFTFHSALFLALDKHPRWRCGRWFSTWSTEKRGALGNSTETHWRAKGLVHRGRRKDEKNDRGNNVGWANVNGR